VAEIRYTAVHHRFGSRVVLDGIDLTISERRVGIVGANGSGKSTMARMINGLVSPTSGTVTVDGQDTTSKGRDVRRRVGFVFTDPDNQIVMPTVAEDVAFSLRRSGLSKAEVTEREVTREELDAAIEADENGQPAEVKSEPKKKAPAKKKAAEAEEAAAEEAAPAAEATGEAKPAKKAPAKKKPAASAAEGAVAEDATAAGAEEAPAPKKKAPAKKKAEEA